MATASAQFKSREDHRKQIELEEARKAGLAPAELDEDGKEINPHIPQYMSSAPWYLNAERPSLKHQRNWKGDGNYTDQWYDRGAKVYQADRYRKGACINCGAMTHQGKDCLERPRKVGAKWTSKHIAPDEKLQHFELNFEGKRDRWNGYDASAYSRVIDQYEVREEARRKYQKEQQLKRLADKKEEPKEGEEDEDGMEDFAEEEEEKVDESKQVDFAKVERRVRTTGGGSTGTVRNLRIREDTAKYLLNLDVNSAYYDPKTRSMRENPNPEDKDRDNFYLGDNETRVSGQALEFKQLNIHAWESFDKGVDIHLQAAPSQAELLHRAFKVKKDTLQHQTRDELLAKYGDAAAPEKLPEELLLGQTERQVEYDRAGRVVKGQEKAVARSKYEEDVYINNHTTVWGSWWKEGQWGYKCCHQMVRQSYCTGEAGIQAAEAATDLLRTNLERNSDGRDGAAGDKGAAEKEKEKKNLATWGTDVVDDLQLDKKKLRAALRKEEEKGREEKDERKRKYNVTYSNDVTAEDMEAYRLTRTHYDDPMKDFVGTDDG
eukprot:TRINITY_DN17059_c0_g1_i1.p1 TRINITY_DN17059_c0_g1~~TRINITY_DN17059_c0_g1_i1.p1  ORF type:complete len:547 (+),score=149.52 TRINITY_DN17059_c0_g1_i1:120-1760(+)